MLLMIDMLTKSAQPSSGGGFWPRSKVQKSTAETMGMFGSKVDNFDHFGQANS